MFAIDQNLKRYQQFLYTFNLNWKYQSFVNLISLEIAITKNNLLATIPRMSTEWSISFQFRQTSLSPVWTNIIRFASANTTYGSPITIGKRIPAVFININSRKLHFTHAVNGMANYIVNGEATDNKLNDNLYIEIHQRYVSRGDYRFSSKSTVLRSIQLSTAMRNNITMSIFLRAIHGMIMQLDSYLMSSSLIFFDHKFFWFLYHVLLILSLNCNSVCYLKIKPRQSISLI